MPAPRDTGCSKSFLVNRRGCDRGDATTLGIPDGGDDRFVRGLTGFGGHLSDGERLVPSGPVEHGRANLKDAGVSRRFARYLGTDSGGVSDGDADCRL